MHTDREVNASESRSTTSEDEDAHAANTKSISDITEVADETCGNGSIAHQIIGQFVRELGTEEDYSDIAKRLKAVIFVGRPTEAALRTALFGEIDL